jgi:hypothetical protein
MRNPILIVTFLLSSFALLWAQQPSRSSSGDPSQSTVHGCLKGGPGAFTLAAHNGTTYELVGDSQQLSKLSGKEVSVSGMKGSASGISAGMSGHTGEATSNPTAGTAPTIRVSSAVKLADQCAK